MGWNKQAQGRGGYETDVVHRGILPKNQSYEVHINTKRYAAGHGSFAEPFFDVREYWYKDGPVAPPVPTGKGIMIHRRYLVRFVLMLLKTITDEELVNPGADLPDNEKLAARKIADELRDTCRRIASVK